MDLPEYARVDGKTVYVRTFAQALDVVDYIDDSYSVVIEDRTEALEARKVIFAFESAYKWSN